MSHAPAWDTIAACYGRGGLMDDPGKTQRALAVCGVCPVLGECRTWALAQGGDLDPGGVCGGLTVAQRAQARTIGGPFKVCTRCRNAKPLDAFEAAARSRDGLRPHCGPCAERVARLTRRNKRIKARMEATTRARKKPGTKPGSTKIPLKKYAAARRDGLNISQAAERLGISRRTAQRYELLIPAVPPAPTRWCLSCHTDKPLADFPTSDVTPDGRKGWCFPCYARLRALAADRRLLRTTS